MRLSRVLLISFIISFFSEIIFASNLSVGVDESESESVSSLTSTILSSLTTGELEHDIDGNLKTSSGLRVITNILSESELETEWKKFKIFHNKYYPSKTFEKENQSNKIIKK
jgi:hypothetical protein